MTINEHAAPPAAEGVERNELALQIGSTMIPDLGMTFAEAAAKVIEVKTSYETNPPADGPNYWHDPRPDEWHEYREAILSTPPKTSADAVSVLDMLLDKELGMPAGDHMHLDLQALTLLRDRLLMMVDAGWKADARPKGLVERLLGSTVLPKFGITFAEARERVRQINEKYKFLPADAEDEYDEIHAEWSPYWEAILTTEPKTLRDAFAVLDLLSCPKLGLSQGPGVYDEGAVKRVQTLVTEILAAAAGAPGEIGDNRAAEADRHLLSDLRRWLELENAETDSATEEMLTAESLAVGDRIAAYYGNPILGMAVRSILIWAGDHPAIRDGVMVSGIARPPAVEDAENEWEALLSGLVRDALRAVPELDTLAAPFKGSVTIARLAGRAPDQSTEWEDTIAAFEAAAEQVLSLPVPPTTTILKAGAQALGITEEQFGRAYAAAAEAHLKEIAA